MELSKNKNFYSIICPVFNTESFLRECVDSVINQTYKNWELILVDDGSTDESPLICDEYSSKFFNIKTIHAKNQGQYFARIEGIRNSKGSRILFLDSDDYLDSKSIEILDQHLSDDADIIVFNMDTFSCDEKLQKRSFYMVDHDALYQGNDIFKFFFFESFIFNLCRTCFDSSLFSDDVLTSNNLANSKIGEDTVFLTKILKKAQRVKTISDILYYYRMREDSATHKKNFENAIARVNVLNYLYGDLKIPCEYVNIIANRVSWPIITAFLYSALSTGYKFYKTKVIPLFALDIYKKYFGLFKTESKFYSVVAKSIGKKRLFKVYLLARVFKRKVA